MIKLQENIKLASVVSAVVLGVNISCADNVASVDSAAYTQLKEVIVEGKTQWIENGKAVFLPSKQAKHHAKNMEQMVRIMNTPVLTVENGEIKTSTGEAVAVFINGVPVDQLDRETFWANNVLRMEFYPESDDPRFQGKRNVVNFIMKEYIVGGVTRLNGDQIFSNEGDYRLSSKLVVKKMTYNIMANGGYSRDYSQHSEKQESFADIWYGQEHYDLVQREETSNSVSRQNEFTSAANARYKADKITVTHGVSFNWNQNPLSTDRGAVSYSPAIIGAGQMISQRESRNSAVRIYGQYLPQLSKKWAFNLNWAAQYNHKNYGSSYSETEAAGIANSARENSWAVSASARLANQLTKLFGWAVDVNESYEKYRTNYGGSAVSLQDMSLNKTQVTLQALFNISRVIGFVVKPTLSIYQRNVNDAYNKTDVLPGLSGNLIIRPQAKLYMGVGLSYYVNTPASSYCNDLILRQTELKWVEGNPGISTNNRFFGNIYCNWMPLQWFGMTGDISAGTENNNYAISYRSGGEEYEGIIGQYINGLKEEHVGASVNFAFKPLKGAMQINAGMFYQYNGTKGMFHAHEYRPKLNVSWYVSDFSFSAGCSGPQKYVKNGGTEIYKWGWQYDFSVGYGNGNFMCDLEVNNPFNKYWLNRVTVKNGPYSSQQLNWTRGRDIRISVTYYFDYGKKTNPSIEIDGGGGSSTSILGL